MARQSSLKFASKPKRQFPETELQKKICQLLLLTGKPNMIYFAVPNGVRMSIRTAAHQKAIGMRAGVSDLVIDIGGRIHYLEVKAKDGRQSPEQKAFEATATAQGSPYSVVYNFMEAQAILEQWGAIRPSKRTTTTFARAA